MKWYFQTIDRYLFYHFFSKLLEQLIYNPIIGFINENKLLHDYQFGFQKGKSTFMAMVMLTDKISDALDRGDCVIGGVSRFF